VERFVTACADLDLYHRQAAKAASIQAGVLWQDFGEKPTHFFHQLARRKTLDSTWAMVQPLDRT
jgi:hypothetical protein